MKENLNQRIEEPIQTFAGAPGVPGGTPIYMEEFPAETTNDTTKYNSKNAIWNSGATGGYKNISFANNACGVQFKAGGPKSEGASGYPGGPYMGKLSVRTKVTGTDGYSEWHEIYHKGNLNLSNFVTTANLNAKADKSYVDSAVASKASTAYVDNAIANKADKSELNAKADKTYVDNKVAGVSSSIVCTGYVYHSSISCSNGINGFCSAWGGGNYQINLNTNITGASGVTITPMSSSSANISTSVHNVVGSTFSVSITKNGAGFDCPFYFQVFQY